MRLSVFILGFLVVATAGCSSLPMYFSLNQDKINKAAAGTEPPPNVTNSGWQLLDGSVHSQ
jgi:hypothetical protein